jgi:hypothetical protein
MAGLAALLVVAAWSAAHATSSTPDQGPPPELVALKKAASTFPQPVKVGDLAGRTLLEPDEAQRILGRVARMPVVTGPDGATSLIVDRGGLFGLGATTVAVPKDALALLGEHVVLIGLSPEAFAALPAYAPQGFTATPADTTISMGIVGPFH